MASNMSFFTSLFLLLLIFTQGIPSIDGRSLNLEKSKEPQLTETTTKIVGNFDGDMQAEIRTNEESFATAPPTDEVTGASPPPPPRHDTSDFRPTAPGHSPGVGHSVHN